MKEAEFFAQDRGDFLRRFLRKRYMEFLRARKISIGWDVRVELVVGGEVGVLCSCACSCVHTLMEDHH